MVRDRDIWFSVRDEIETKTFPRFHETRLRRLETASRDRDVETETTSLTPVVWIRERYRANFSSASRRCTPCLKNVPPLHCYNFDACEQILIFLAEMLPIKQAIRRCFTMPPQLVLLLYRYLEKWGNTKIALFTQMLCIAGIQPASWFLQSFWLTTHTDSAVWLPNSCNQCIHLGVLGGMVQDNQSRELCKSWTVLHAKCTSALFSGFSIS